MEVGKGVVEELTRWWMMGDVWWLDEWSDGWKDGGGRRAHVLVGDGLTDGLANCADGCSEQHATFESMVAF